jgi:hypothetical protein
MALRRAGIAQQRAAKGAKRNNLRECCEAARLFSCIVVSKIRYTIINRNFYMMVEPYLTPLATERSAPV